MNYENWISYRYLTAKKGRFLSFLQFVSIAGIAIGVMVLIVVIGIMQGFQNNLREKIIGTTPHVQVEKETGVKDFKQVQEQLTGIPSVVATSPYIQGNVFIEFGGHSMGQVLRGIEPASEEKITKIKEYLKEGELDSLQGDGIIIGNELARYYSFSLGDELTVIAPGSGIEGRGWRYPMKVVGIFNSGMVDVDMNLSLIGLEKAQEIFNFEQNSATGVGVKLKDPEQAKEAQKDIYNLIGHSFLVRTWIDANRGLFEALQLEKWGLFLVLTLIVVVAAFNIISTLIVTITSKIHDIGILQSFGVPRSSIRRIFTKQGMFIGIIGTMIGLLLGLGVSYILATYVEVPAEIYSIEHVPVDLVLSDVLIIIGSSLLIILLASIFPAIKAAHLQPVEALRYE